MAKRRLPPHHRFPKDGRIWRLAWFGNLQFNPSVPTEPTIEVFLLPLTTSNETPVQLNYTSAYDTSAGILVEVGIGYLPSLRVGSFWRNGVPYRLPKGAPKYNEATLTISAATPETVSCVESSGYAQRKNGRDYYIPRSYYPLQVQGKFSATSGISLSKCLRFTCEVEFTESDGITNKERQIIIVPCIEILRFYYASSTALAREIVGGGTGSSMHDPHNTLYNTAPNLTYINMETGEAFIQLRRRMRDADASAIARLRFSDYAFARARDIYGSILKNRSNDARATIIEAYPPFDTSTKWTTRGKRFKFGEYPSKGEPDTREWHYLVYEILTCSAPFPFMKLWFDRDNDGRSKINPETPEEYFAKPEAYKNTARNVDQTPFDGSQAGITNDNEPSLDYPAYEIINDAVRFPDLKNKEVKKLPQNRTTHRAASSMVHPDNTDEPDSYSTGEPGYADVTTAPFTVTLSALSGMTNDEVEEAKPDEAHDQETHKSNAKEREFRNRQTPIPASFDMFLKVLDELKHLADIQWSLIPVVPGDADAPSHEMSVFPLRPYENNPHKFSNWSFIDAKFMKLRRQVAIAELRYNLQYYYLVEAEHRPDIDKDGNLKESFSMLLVATKAGDGKTTIADLLEVLRYCVSNRAVQLYDNELTFLRRASFKHSSHLTERTAKRVLKGIKLLRR